VLTGTVSDNAAEDGKRQTAPGKDEIFTAADRRTTKPDCRRAIVEIFIARQTLYGRLHRSAGDPNSTAAAVCALRKRRLASSGVGNQPELKILAQLLVAHHLGCVRAVPFFFRNRLYSRRRHQQPTGRRGRRDYDRRVVRGRPKHHRPAVGPVGRRIVMTAGPAQGPGPRRWVRRGISQ